MNDCPIGRSICEDSCPHFNITKVSSKRLRYIACALPKEDTLTDDQCDKFRRMPGTFNDMVRAIYRAGVEAGNQS